MFHAIARAFAHMFKKPAPAMPYNMPRSKKHIRITHWTFDVTIGYYGHSGKKLTIRNDIKYSDLARLIANARALGYRVI